MCIAFVKTKSFPSTSNLANYAAIFFFLTEKKDNFTNVNLVTFQAENMHCLLFSDKTNPVISILSMSKDLRQPNKTYFRVICSHRSMGLSKPY